MVRRSGYGAAGRHRPYEGSGSLSLDLGVVWSCFCDGSSTYEEQAIVWLKTLRHVADRVEPAVIHAFGASRRLIAEADRHGAELVEVDRLHPSHGPSNKLAQLTSPILAEASCVVLCDCDLAFCGDLDPALGGEHVRAKLVDLPNPPIEKWRWLFAEAGFRTAPRTAETTHDHAVTYANNFNGGLYVLPRQAFRALRTAWPSWNAWVLERAELLDPWGSHADQISFGLALEELELEVWPLDSGMNFPSHLDYADRPDADVSGARIIHYHQLDKRGRLKRTGLPNVDHAIDRVNTRLDTLAGRTLTAPIPAT